MPPVVIPMGYLRQPNNGIAIDKCIELRQRQGVIDECTPPPSPTQQTPRISSVL